MTVLVPFFCLLCCALAHGCAIFALILVVFSLACQWCCAKASFPDDNWWYALYVVWKWLTWKRGGRRRGLLLTRDSRTSLQKVTATRTGPGNGFAEQINSRQRILLT